MLSTELENTNLELVVEAEPKIVYDTVHFAVSFENKLTTDVSLLSKNSVTFSDDNIPAWRWEVFFQDSILMTPPFMFISRWRKPTKQDYFLVKPGDSYKMKFSLDMSSLRRGNPLFSHPNQDYGEYSIRLFYKDRFCVAKNAYRGKIYSNVVKVTYIKED